MSRVELGSALQIVRNPRVYVLGSGLLIIAGTASALTGIAFVTPWLRVTLALLIFLLPGGFLFALVPTRDSWDLIDFVGYGFAFSIALMTLLGLVTRTLAWSIDIVEFAWYLLAILGFVAVFTKTRRLPLLNLQMRPPMVALLAIVLILVALYAHSSVLATPTTDDQNRHHAAVSGFLRSEPLGWSEPYYETGNAIADRMYLTYWVLAQALVVQISDVPVLLARYLINPFVMIMSVAAMYVFARNLGHNRQASLQYVILGLLAYSLVMQYGPQPGSQFFVRPLLDKVVAAFALAPIAISSVYFYAASGNRRAYLGFALSFLAAASVHSIAGGFAACIIGIWCLIRLITERGNWKNSLQIGLLTLLLFSPAILVRLTTSETTIYNFDELTDETGAKVLLFDAINALDHGNRFYAIHPTLAGDLTYILIALALLAALLRRLNSRAKLMLAYALAIGVGLLPYTAWIYGRLVSVEHVVRVLWLMPFGYMLGFAIETIWAHVSRYLPRAPRLIEALGQDRLLTALLILALPITAHFLGSNHRVDFSRDIGEATAGDHELLEIADYIDAHHDERVWIAASHETRNRVILMNWKVISLSRFTAERMSYYSNMPIEQAETQLLENFLLYEAEVPVEDKLAIIDHHGIDYLLFPKGYAWIVDALYQTDKERFELVYSGETLRLVKVH